MKSQVCKKKVSAFHLNTGKLNNWVASTPTPSRRGLVTTLTTYSTSFFLPCMCMALDVALA